MLSMYKVRFLTKEPVNGQRKEKTVTLEATSEDEAMEKLKDEALTFISVKRFN